MSTADDYTPKPGGVADRAIAHLRTLAPGAELSSPALAEAIGAACNAMAPSLVSAVERGALYRRQKGGHPRSPAFWSLRDHSGVAPKECADLPVRQIVRPANGAPPLPIVPPLFPRAPAEDDVSCCAGDAADDGAKTPQALPASARAPVRLAAGEPAAEPAFRCGLFSDGEFILEANGQRVRLDRDQTQRLVGFFDRIVTEPAR